MNRFKTLQDKCDMFGVLVVFECFNNKNPIVYHLINDSDEHYIYFEVKKYSFLSTYIIKTNLDEMKKYKETNISFNECFLGKKYRVSVFKTHVEVDVTDEKVNELEWHSNNTYIDTYERVQSKIKHDKKYKYSGSIQYIGYFTLICSSLSFLIPIRWMAISFSIFFFTSTLVLLYIGFYKFMKN